MKISFPFLFLLVLFGCKPDEKITPSNPAQYATKLDLVWMKPIDKNYGAPLGVDSMLIYCEGGNYSIKCIDVSTGEDIWVSHGHTGGGEAISFLYQDKFVLNRSEETVTLDVNTGVSLWETDAPGTSQIRIQQNELYQIWSWEFPNEPHQKIMKTTIEEGRWKEVVTITPDSVDGYKPNLTTPQLWLNPGGDSVFVFLNYGETNDSMNQESLDLYAINVSKNEWELVIKGIVSNVKLTMKPPVVDENVVYIEAEGDICAFSLLSGEILWKRSFKDRCSNLLIYDNLLLSHIGSGVYGIDKRTGGTIWECMKIGSANAIGLKGNLIFGCTETKNQLFAVNADSGKLVMRLDAGRYYGDPLFERSFGVSEDLKYVFRNTADSLMCYKMPGYN